MTGPRSEWVEHVNVQSLNFVVATVIWHVVKCWPVVSYEIKNRNRGQPGGGPSSNSWVKKLGRIE
jgi:hypothetical protein